ncbi:SprB repeat-containing protein, partial [Candidatus Amoebophilus asiaticus]|nr:SprB repeat-containing protein [Candidatus Amoebophilus asiaticus]
AGPDTTICLTDSAMLGAIPTASGGTPLYNYSWNPSTGLSSATISNPNAGPLATTPYILTVTDLNSCIALDTVVVTIEPLPVPNAGPDTTICEGETVTISASGGGTYSWSPGGATTSSITVSPTSTTIYIVTVTSAASCSQTDTVTVTVNPSPAASITGTNVTCNGGNDGATNLTVLGGTAPFTYAWSNGATIEDLTNITAGTYTVTVTDANNCFDIASITITEPPAIVITTGSTDATCGNSDGSATATGTGGTGSLTYTWSTGATTQTITSVPGGTYTVTVADANGCFQSAIVSVNDLGGPNVYMTDSTDASCNGGSDGTATASVTGGTLPYTYSWIPSGGTDSIGTGLSAGSYTIQVTDSNGCIASAVVTIGEPAALTPLTAQTNVSCNGSCDGTASISGSGGTPAYTYSWSTGATTTSITSLCPGTYYVTITDANQCTVSTSVTISEPVVLSVAMGSTDVSCNGGSDGTAGATASGGTLPYTYTWSNSATTANISGLTIGTYMVTVQDANNCLVIDSITVNEPTILGVNITSTNVSCNGGSDGTAKASAFGGTPAYTYNWTTGATSDSIGGLAAGTYTVTVTDANGCQTIESIIITQPAIIGLSMTKSDVTCNGGNDGQASVAVVGGFPAYTYQWSSGGTAPLESSLSAGTYTVTVIDANGCIAIDSIVINEPTPITLFMSSDDANCGQTDGKARVSASGGTTPYTYSWSNGATTANNNGVATGTYTVTVTDNNGCIAIDSVIVNDLPGPTVVITDSVDVSCNGNNDGTATVSAYGGTTPYIYLWSNSATTVTISSLSPGIYTATVTDANGCVGTASVTINEPAVLIITMGKTDASCNSGNDGTASATVSGGTNPYTYNWSNGGTGSSISNLIAGTYTVTVRDANNCSSIDSITINEPIAISLTTGKTDVSCNGGNDGTASVTASGGTIPYTYSWSNGGAGQTEISLTAGIYTVTVTDANGCTATASITINEPTALSIN